MMMIVLIIVILARVGTCLDSSQCTSGPDSSNLRHVKVHACKHLAHEVQSDTGMEPRHALLLMTRMMPSVMHAGWIPCDMMLSQGLRVASAH